MSALEEVFSSTRGVEFMRARKASTVAAILVVLIALAILAFSHGFLHRYSSTTHDMNPQSEDVVSARLHDPEHPRYDYVRDTDSLELIRTRFKDLRIGDPSRKVIQLLGEPSDEIFLQEKTKPGSVGVPRRTLEYRVKTLVTNMVNVKYDSGVEFYFDENDQLTRVNSSVEGISSLP